MNISWLYRLAIDFDASPLPNNNTADAPADKMAAILQVVFGVATSIALLIIVISGLRYIISAGDPGKMAQAKKGVIFALVGLVVALSAFSIVTFVVRGV